MTARLISRGCLVVLIGVGCAGPAALLRAQGPDLGTDAQRASGKQLYAKYCAQCHGEKGDGEGYATPHLSPRPRNFTTGKFKVRTTPNGALPTHQDLVNIIRRGMPYTSMPAWPNLSDQQVSELAYFIKTFSPDFADGEKVPQPVADARARRAPRTRPSRRGRSCTTRRAARDATGTLGRGDGPSAPTLKDDFGHPIRAADLAQSWTFRGGSSREDIFRTMSTGFNGTPMPAFVDGLTPEQRWAITDFIVSLSGSDGPRYTNLVVAKPVRDPIDVSKGAASFASAPVARFPIIGQIMEPGRAFAPPATSVTVQAIYDAESIALLVRWHDRTAEKTGQNGPALPVPPEEEVVSAPAAEPSAADPFGDAEVAPGAQPAAAGSLRPDRRASRGGLRVLRRRRDPDSLGGADRRAQALLHLRRQPEPGGSLVLRSGQGRAPPVHRQGKRRHHAERRGWCHRRRQLRPGRMVGHLQAGTPSRSRGGLRARRRSCRSRSRSGTGSRASVGTGAGSRCGTRSTSNPRTSPRRRAR